MPVSTMPYEVLDFERLLHKPNSDPTGLASLFASGEIWITRAPARLDVIGGMLTEINITSPTGVQHVSRLENRNVAAPIMDCFERMSRAIRR